MKRPLALVLALVTATAACSSAGTASGAPASAGASGDPSLVDIGADLRGASGLTATVYAAGPEDIAAFAYDAERRLWLGTAAYSDSGSDGIYLVDDGGTAGGAERSTEVVSGLHTILGLLWDGDELYVAAAGGVTAYGGFDGTRFATTRVVLSLPAGTGEVDGIVLGPDGRMRLGISAPCDHCTPTSEYSASIVSFEPDGSDLRIEASGIRAPVGLAYIPGTDDLLVSMDQRDDLGAATPGDWLGLVGAGEDWGFPGCYGQGGTACTSVPSPVAVLDPHAAVSGVAIVGDSLGPTVGPAALVAEWSLGKVEAVRLEPTADGYSGTAVPFITGIGAPVAVVVAPDGAVLVGDWKTGAIYRIARA